MRARRDEAGFSLLEILVAFVIMALALGALMRVFSGSLHNTSQLERYASATLIAESRLAALGIESPLEEGATEGDAGNGYQWTTRVMRESSHIGPDGATAFALFDVEVRVGWRDGTDKERHVSLLTQRTGPVP